MTARPLWPAWPGIARRLARATWLAVFLDFDGTLAPIASHPARARLPQDTKRVLTQLLRCPQVRVSLISGRALRDLRRMVKLRGLWYVGNHGLELSGPGRRYVHPAARQTRARLRRIANELIQAVRPIRGAWVEDKGWTLSVHDRAVTPARRGLLKRRVRGIVRPFQHRRDVRVSAGKRVIEIRPPTAWGKGSAVRWLLAKWATTRHGATMVPIYIGDDRTDEDAFQALHHRGVTVAVGPATPHTRAHYVVRSPREVQRLLRQLVALRRARGKRDGTPAGR